MGLAACRDEPDSRPVVARAHVAGDDPAIPEHPSKMACARHTSSTGQWFRSSADVPGRLLPCRPRPADPLRWARGDYCCLPEGVSPRRERFAPRTDVESLVRPLRATPLKGGHSMRIETPARAIALFIRSLSRRTIGSPPQRGVGTSFVFGMQRVRQGIPVPRRNKHRRQRCSFGRFFLAPRRRRRQASCRAMFDVHIEDFRNAWYGHPI